MFSIKDKLEKTIINSLKHQKFWNIVEVLKHQKKMNGVWCCNAFVVELWGVFEGLKFVWERGFKRVELHVDLSLIVLLVRSTLISVEQCWLYFASKP